MHDMGWRRILRCAGCRLVRADPLPSIDEKEKIETRGYTDASEFPEVRDFFANCNRDFVEDPVIREMRRHLAGLGKATGRPGQLLDVGAGTGILMHLAVVLPVIVLGLVLLKTEGISCGDVLAAARGVRALGLHAGRGAEGGAA